MSEVEWRPIPEWEGFYEVSNDGRVRSLERVNRRGITVHSRMLKLSKTKAGSYSRVSLCLDGEKYPGVLHRLVMLAFVGECPKGLEVLHADGNPSNNCLSNLSYGTHADNNRDIVKHGRHVHAGKTHCKQGHLFSEENTRHDPAQRVCRTCSRAAQARFKERRRAAKSAALNIPTKESE